LDSNGKVATVNNNKGTIVTLTPLAVEKDSRTFKQASSLARYGFNSVVVECSCSDLQKNDLLFSLSSPECVKNDDCLKKTNTKRTMFQRILSMPRKALKLTRKTIQMIVKSNKVTTYLYAQLSLLLFIYNYLKDNYTVSKRIPRADLYYLHSPYHFPAVWFLSLRYKAPFIYDAHDFYPHSVDLDSLSKLRRKQINFYTWIEKKCVKNAAAVVTVSDGVAKLISNYFSCNPIVINNSHDSRLDQRPEKTIREVLCLNNDDFIIIAVGNAKPQLAIENAIESMKQLPAKCHLVFVGNNYDEYMHLIDDKRSKQRIHFIPPVKPFEIVPFIKDANTALVLYHPLSVNDKNALPNKFFQSVAALLPVLYPTLPEILKVTSKYQIGLPIEPLSPDSISDGVLSIMQKDESNELYIQNLQKASQEFCWEVEEKHLVKLVDKLIG
jgi:glycosyltransferase involved in cell wall biosynthesis